MSPRFKIAEFKWIILALIISFVLESISSNSTTSIDANNEVRNTFLGLNLFLEILVFFVFSTFVVFGIKGFFEMYSQKITNGIILSTGIMLVLVILILAYKLLFQEPAIS